MALELLGEIDPNTREAVFGSLPAAELTFGKITGFEGSSQGVWKRFRLDWDEAKGSHINVEVGKKDGRLRWAVTWPATQEEFSAIREGNV
jgi:hypothetical protein